VGGTGGGGGGGWGLENTNRKGNRKPDFNVERMGPEIGGAEKWHMTPPVRGGWGVDNTCLHAPMKASV